MDWNQSDSDLKNCPCCHSNEAMLVQAQFGYQVTCQHCGTSGPRESRTIEAMTEWNKLPRASLQAAERDRLNHALQLVEKTLTPKRRKRRKATPSDIADLGL